MNHYRIFLSLALWVTLLTSTLPAQTSNQPNHVLDLDGRGIRSIERVGSSWLIVTGPTADRGRFALYRWSGRAGDAAALVTGVDLKNLRPEALFALPGSGHVQLLSDDGGVNIAGVECKELPAARQTFRSLTLTTGE